MSEMSDEPVDIEVLIVRSLSGLVECAISLVRHLRSSVHRLSHRRSVQYGNRWSDDPGWNEYEHLHQGIR